MRLGESSLDFKAITDDEVNVCFFPIPEALFIQCI